MKKVLNWLGVICALGMSSDIPRNNYELAAARVSSGKSTPISISPFLTLTSIRSIKCGESYGTASVIGSDMLLTASHVVGLNATCIDTTTGAIGAVTVTDSKLDTAILVIDTTNMGPPMPYRCSGYIRGQTYFSIGYATGPTNFIMFSLRAGPIAKKTTIRDGRSFYGLRQLDGTMIRGMSGGPIVDMTGMIVGTNQITDYSNHTGLSREIKDTVLCKPDMKEKLKPKNRMMIS